MSTPSACKFTQEHEWISLSGDTATIGISLHAVEELGEIVYVDLPKVGAQFGQMDEFGTVESVKTLSSLYMPLAGEVTQVNATLVKDPGTLNESPYEDGWLIKIKIADENEYHDLMTYEEYQQYLSTL